MERKKKVQRGSLKPGGGSVRFSDLMKQKTPTDRGLALLNGLMMMMRTKAGNGAEG